MIKIFWEKQSWKELILMEALPKLYLLHPTIQVLNAANSENLKIKSFEKLAHSESETDYCGLLRNIFASLQNWWFADQHFHCVSFLNTLVMENFLSSHFQLIIVLANVLHIAKIEETDFFVFSKIFSFLV